MSRWCRRKRAWSRDARPSIGWCACARASRRRRRSLSLSAAQTLKSRAFTAYSVVSTRAAGEVARVARRFSEFVQLDAQLRSVFQGECASFVALPAVRQSNAAVLIVTIRRWLTNASKRTLFKRNQFDEALIESRRVQLQIYLQFLLKKGFVERSTDLRSFLGIEDDSAFVRDASVLSEDETDDVPATLSATAAKAGDDNDDDDDNGAWLEAKVQVTPHNVKAAILSVFHGLGEAQRIYQTPNIPLDKFKNAKKCVCLYS